jgi:hypothetical protein
MLNIKKILLPVDFPNTSLEVVHQAATFAHHFHSEIVMLHVVTAQSHAAGVPEDGPEFAAWDVLAEITKRARKNLDQSLGRSLTALPSDPHWSKATRPAPLCRWLRRKSRPDHDAVPWLHVQSVSAGLCNGESTGRVRVPGLDQCARGRIAGAGVCDPQRTVRGGFRPS